MMSSIRVRFLAQRLVLRTVPLAVLLAAALLGARASTRWLALFVSAAAGALVFAHPSLGLVGLVLAALVLRMEVGTGTEVALNPATLTVPALLVVWLFRMVRQRSVRLAPSRTNRPLLLFLLAGLLSLLIGTAYWDPAVPRSSNFTLVQLAQWAMFAFAAIAFWLTGNLVQDLTWLRRLTFFFLALAGGLALLLVTPSSRALVGHVTTRAVDIAPFWMLLAAMAGGQLLHNQRISWGGRLFLVATLVAVALYAFYLQREVVSNWVGVGAAVGVLVWLRWPRLRWPVILLVAVLAVSGVLSSAIYKFAGGADEWVESGGSRLVLIGRVLEVTMRNPITGLGPAAYRRYAGMEPLFYRGAYWVAPQINSHNNYVDLFSHVGLLGLALFGWFAVELALLGLRLRRRFTEGFAAGYVNGALAAGAGSLALMLFADWILPFVYNIGFPGFQASLLVWLFLGGLVALENMPGSEVAA